MVDFKKKRLAASQKRPVDPIEIYGRLDRASDKGPLRAAQERVLQEWHRSRRAATDVILKLHTGQGKTLLGLLMLQSKLNELDGRALYLCPNLFLVRQTLHQAKQFGISCLPVEDDGSIPSGFLEGKSILVATVQKLFNGLTKFGLDTKSTGVDYIVVDDAHACIDSIRTACQISLPRKSDAYRDIFSLFDDDLKRQGAGSYAEIVHSVDLNHGPLLPIPYWAWMAREDEVATILMRNSHAEDIKFAWPLLRDRLKYCQCLVSARELAIIPYLPPLEKFRSYTSAKHRIFMSATVTDDAFLIKGLGLSKEVISTPLVDPDETWSGEKMILMPSVTSPTLDQTFIITEFGKQNPARKHNVVVLAPSFPSTLGWEAAGAIVAQRETIDSHVADLRKGISKRTLVIANRYDGIDLPDEACRILILDGKPFGETLWERYTDDCRFQSEVSIARIARTVEQGLGRAVRGEKDYCVVIITSPDLVRLVRSREMQKFLSEQTKEQVQIGLQISDEAREDIESTDPPFTAIASLIKQCLDRDEDWKEYYKERMDAVRPTYKKSGLLSTFSTEREAEIDFQLDRFSDAVQKLQDLVDSISDLPDSEKGWYLQEMARYEYSASRTQSQKKQAAAHKNNRLLLKPEATITSKLGPLSQKRSAAIVRYLQDFASAEEAALAIEDICNNLRFGVRAEAFEKAWDDLGTALGFACERPDKEWKEGPDNLWALRTSLYLLVECKSEVESTRAKINKDEAGQMNNSCAWFEREYKGAESINVMIIPTAKVTSSAGFNRDVRIMKKRGLVRFVHHVKAFFRDLARVDRKELDEAHVHNTLLQHKLSMDDFVEEFTSRCEVAS